MTVAGHGPTVALLAYAVRHNEIEQTTSYHLALACNTMQQSNLLTRTELLNNVVRTVPLELFSG